MRKLSDIIAFEW